MSPSPQFRLQWKNHLPNFISVFAQLLNSESLVDVTLSADGRQIQAHRVVLSACSSYFKELFVSHPCQHPIIILKDVKYRDLCTVIHFMYHGEVNIAQENLDSILQTAATLHVKGFSDVVDKETFTSPLITHEPQSPSDPPPSSEVTFTEQQTRPFKRKHHFSGSSYSRLYDQQSRDSPSLTMHETRLDSEGRSGSSVDSGAIIKDKLDMMEQKSNEFALTRCFRESAIQESASPKYDASTIGDSSSREISRAAKKADESSSLDVSNDSSQSKTKRIRPLLRQQCVKKETEQRGNLSPPNSLLAILPKSSASLQEPSEMLEQKTQTFLHIPAMSCLPRQRSQPILPSQISVAPISSSAVPANLMIEPFPTTILRLMSFDEVGHQSLPTRCTANSLQFSVGDTEDSPTQEPHRHKAKIEENVRHSMLNPGTPSSSAPVTVVGRSGHCPELRMGAALGCNYCWNTVDNHGRVLRRKTKYHCPECQANLCIVPCFQQYHEKFSSLNSDGPAESSGSGPARKGSLTPQQQLSKMSSI